LKHGQIRKLPLSRLSNGRISTEPIPMISQRKLLLVVLFGLTTFFLQCRPNYDVDVFWQLKLGQLMLERQELVRHDPFTSTHAGEPVPPIAWLSQVAYALIHRVGSWRLLHLVNALVFAGALWLAALTVRRGETSTLANALGLDLGILVMIPHCEIRPHGFAALGLAVLLWTAHAKMRAWKKLILACLVLLVWQNMHPSVMLAAVLLAAWAVCGWWRWWRDRRVEKPWLPTVLALLAAVSTMATPMGADIFASSARNSEISRALEISEWMPLWHRAAIEAGAQTVWLALAVSLALLIGVRKHVRLEELATLVVLGAASIAFYRMALFFAVAMVPIWSRWIHAAWPDAPGASTTDRPVGRLPTWAIIAAVLLGAWLVPGLLGLNVLDRRLPLRAAGRLRERGVRGVIYNYREWGGPLIWTGYPDWKVTIDGRLYLFDPEEWNRYEQIAAGRVPLDQVEQWYHPDAFFLRPSYHEGLIKLLRASDAWEKIDGDAESAVFVRRQE